MTSITLIQRSRDAVRAETSLIVVFIFVLQELATGLGLYSSCTFAKRFSFALYQKRIQHVSKNIGVHLTVRTLLLQGL